MKQLYSLTGEPANTRRSFLFNGDHYDIGHRIVKPGEPRGYPSFPERSRDSEAQNPVDLIDKLVVHHSGADRRNPGIMHNVLVECNLGVHFAGEDDGRAWQFNDLIDMTYHAKGFNKKSIGVELCLFPLANVKPNYYNARRRKHTGNLPHKIQFEVVHGQQYTAFVMPDQQIHAWAKIYAGVWVAIGHQRTDGFTGPFDVAPRFPRVDGEIPRTIVDGIENHVGLMGHFHGSTNKIDPLGFDWEGFENTCRGYYTEFRNNLGQG